MSSLLGGAESAVQQTLRTLLGELERTCSDNEPAQADADAAAAAAATGRSLRVPNHLLAALAAALPDPQVLVMALDLVDHAGSITVCAAAASDRRFFQVGAAPSIRPSRRGQTEGCGLLRVGPLLTPRARHPSTPPPGCRIVGPAIPLPPRVQLLRVPVLCLLRCGAGLFLSHSRTARASLAITTITPPSRTSGIVMTYFGALLPCYQCCAAKLSWLVRWPLWLELLSFHAVQRLECLQQLCPQPPHTQCKHVLAARIASAIGAYDTRMLTETEFSAYLCA